MKKYYIPYLCGVLALALGACGGGGGSGGASGAPAARGSLAVSVMTDAPSCGYDAVNLGISKLRFHQDFKAAADAAGWTELSFSPSRKLSLLNAAEVLSGATTSLGALDLPAGIYTQMVVVFDASASTVKPAGSTAELPLETAASLAAGVRTPVDLNVQGGQKLDLVFDFYACNAIQRRASAYVLKVQPQAVPTPLNGIGGFVDKALLASGVVVTAQQGGAIFSTTVPSPASGEFALPRLPAGNYNVVVQANGAAAAVIVAVPVAVSGVTSVATAAAPIKLAASAASSISGRVSWTAPASAPGDGTWVMASQNIPANAAVGNLATTVVYRMQPADLASGAYTLAGLPQGQASYALYKASLPLALAPAATSLGAGHFKVEAVASGYPNKSTTASANVNLIGANASGVDIPLP